MTGFKLGNSSSFYSGVMGVLLVWVFSFACTGFASTGTARLLRCLSISCSMCADTWTESWRMPLKDKQITYSLSFSSSAVKYTGKSLQTSGPLTLSLALVPGLAWVGVVMSTKISKARLAHSLQTLSLTLIESNSAV